MELTGDADGFEGVDGFGAEEGVAGPTVAEEPTPYDLLQQVSNQLGVVPLCINCYLPDVLAESGTGDHKLVFDNDGQPWMSVASYQKFCKSCNQLQAECLIAKKYILWIVIMPQLSLRDAFLIENLVCDYRSINPMSEKGKGMKIEDGGNGICHGIPFAVKNLHLLKSKAKDYTTFSLLAQNAKSMSSDIGEQLWKLSNELDYGFLMADTAEMREEQDFMNSALCEMQKVRLVLSMYARRETDETDLHGTFGPHEVILKLLPKLHDSIYVGPDRFDPCQPLVNESDEQKQQTETSIREELHKLRDDSHTFVARTSVLQQACLVLKEEATCRKMRELSIELGRMKRAVDSLITEFTSVAENMEEIRNQPTLLGNAGIGPDWLEKEDSEADYATDDDDY